MQYSVWSSAILGRKPSNHIVIVEHKKYESKKGYERNEKNSFDFFGYYIAVINIWVREKPCFAACQKCNRENVAEL